MNCIQLTGGNKRLDWHNNFSKEQQGWFSRKLKGFLKLPAAEREEYDGDARIWVEYYRK
jgi:hypothetical protein